MGNDWFEFKHFRIDQQGDVFRVGTDGVLLGAWAAADSQRVKRILDIGTGTGLLALMLAQRFPGAAITAIEPHKSSWEVAVRNVRASPWAGTIEVLNTSLEEYSAHCTSSYDLVVTNPPFFSGSLKNPDPHKSSFRHAGELTTAAMIEDSLKVMTKEGVLSVIMPWAEGNVMVAEAAAAGLFCSRMVKVRPLHSSPFSRLLLEFTTLRVPPVVRILTMGHPSHGGYTNDYVDLTRDFYLNF